MAVSSAALLALMLVQADQLLRAGAAFIAVNGLALTLLAVNRRGHTRVASIALVAGLVTIVSVLAPTAGGIRSPGVTMFFVFVLMAGLLLGQRAGLITAMVCAGIGLTLAIAGTEGLMPVSLPPYNPLALWLLNCLYMGVVLVLLRLATDAMATALGRAESEIAVRTRTEREREGLVQDLGERVKELRLLHAVARVLQGTRAFDRSVLEHLVVMLPQAWKHSRDCEARITYDQVVVTTPGWRESTWRQSAPFTTSAGSGVVEVVYLQPHPPAAEGPFLAEERALIDSIAEMLAAYLEHDIAERQRSHLETQLRQSQQMEALGTLAGGIAHDFNNLLTAMGSNAEMALTDPSAPTAVREHLTELKKAHARATDLVKRILLFSRRQESHRVPADLAPIVDEAVKLLRASLPPSIEIRFQAPPALPAVFADPSQIHQVVMNLGTNAAQAMGERGGLLKIDLDLVAFDEQQPPASAELGQGAHVRLSVRDTGPGVSPEIKDRLFEPFFTTRGTAGTGLGLSVAHGIVADHDGAIVVESEMGSGATFHVFLPAVEEHAAGPADTPEIVSGHGEHVMYVDDEEALVFVMTRVLKRLGYRCTGYSDADAALEAFRKQPDEFAAVITDMARPRKNGATLAKELRAIRADLPVAIVSGHESAESGPSGTGLMRIAKPVGMEDLSHALRALLVEK